MVILAIVMASAEAVMALGTGSYTGLATAEVWTLLVGQSPWALLDTTSNQLFTTAGVALMDTPAWIVFGLSGFMFVHVCRTRHARRRRFRTVN